MKNNLYKIVDELLSVKDKATYIKEMIKKERDLYSFFDVIYNKNYEYEFDAKFEKTSKWVKENSGFSDWSDIKKTVYKLLIKKDAIQSPNITKILSRYFDGFNQRDIDVILYALKNRKIKKLKDSVIYELFPEFLKSNDNES